MMMGNSWVRLSYVGNYRSDIFVESAFCRCGPCPVRAHPRHHLRMRPLPLRCLFLLTLAWPPANLLFVLFLPIDQRIDLVLLNATKRVLTP